ncbi:MAG: PAS domain S-box protein, partial [Desulfobacteraceae bacterium]|nr:PAS domain S-box protein [Desulfobacteraceae bacterium]
SVTWLNLVLDQKVKEKTANLTKTNELLKTEISERIKAEKKLLESESRFRQMVNDLPIPVSEFDFNFNIQYTNKAARKWFGYAQEDLDAGARILDLIPEDQMQSSLLRMEKLQKGIDPGPIEITLIRKDGTPIWGYVSSSLIYDDKKGVGIRTCFVDLAERRRAEKATLFAAEQSKYALVGQMAGKIANDFNNILGAIMGSAESILENCEDNSSVNNLQTIIAQTKKGKIVTWNLVTFAEDQEPREAYFNLNNTIELILDLQKKELEFVNIVKDFALDIPDLLADPGMIEQILVNLIQNAIHAMSLTSTPKLVIKTYYIPENLYFEIVDNGCGISSKHHNEIYTPSFTLKGTQDTKDAYKKGIKGAGYGLSNVKKYVDKHKGKIHFTSQPGKGTSVIVSIPVIEKELTDKEKKQVAQQTVIKKKNILLVEDEKIIAKVQSSVLTKDPFFHTVKIAPDGESAIELFDSDVFDLISLDYILPGQLDGMDVYNHIRNKDKTIPIIFVSGNVA